MKPAKERFEEFHKLNPQVYDSLKELAYYVKNKGYIKFGIRPLWERLRWANMFELEPDPNSEYRLNDHYKEFYSRMLMKEPNLDGFFTKRRSRADDSKT